MTSLSITGKLVGGFYNGGVHTHSCSCTQSATCHNRKGNCCSEVGYSYEHPDPFEQRQSSITTICPSAFRNALVIGATSDAAQCLRVDPSMHMHMRRRRNFQELRSSSMVQVYYIECWSKSVTARERSSMFSPNCHTHNTLPMGESWLYMCWLCWDLQIQVPSPMRGCYKETRW